MISQFYSQIKIFKASYYQTIKPKYYGFKLYVLYHIYLSFPEKNGHSPIKGK